MMAEKTPRGVVLDAWPVLERLKLREPGLSRFHELLVRFAAGEVDFAISRINYGEIIYSIHKERSFTEDQKTSVLELIERLPLSIVSISDDLVDDAVRLKSRYAISFGDCFGAALSMQRNLPLVTGDPEFRSLETDGLLKLEWVGA